MNDEVRQIHDQTFNRIAVGLLIFSVAMAVAAMIVDGASSAWFARAAILFVAAVVAIVVRFTSRLVVASYVLVLELLVLGTELLFRSNSGFAPYVFIPIVLATGLLLSPTATFVITGIIIITVLVTVIVLGQFSLTGLLLALPPLGITIVAAFLAIQNKRNVNFLGQRLLENRIILRERTLETMETLKRVETLQQQVLSTEKQLKKFQAEAERGRSAILQKNSQLYSLMQESLRELNVSVVELERSFNELITSPYSNGYAGELEMAWHRIHQLRVMLINLEELTGIEHGDIKINYDLVDIDQLVTEVAGTARGLVIDKNVQVRTRLMDDVPTVQADPARLRQVLLHLLNNAVKYTDTGTIEIGAKAEEDRVIVQVSDTGIGMHREEVEQVFEKFSRGDSALAQQRQGGGLGLAISKQLIDLQGGRMWVSSVLGVGTTFYIALPAKMVSETAKNDATILSTKTTRPFDKVDMPALQTTPSSASVLQNSGSNDIQATATKPGLSTSAIRYGSDPVVLSTAAQKKTQFSDNDHPVILRRNTRTSKSPRSATGPVQRFMPFYIQRFGYILLSLLLLVIISVASLATIKYLFLGDTATTIVSADTVGDSEGTVTATSTATPDKIVAFSVKPTATSMLVATEVAAVLASDTPSLPLPTNTPVVIPTNTSAPSATPLPPTATPSPLPTSTNTPVPTNTPTASPTAQVESAISQSKQLLFTAGQQLIFDQNTVEENSQNIIPDANSRVSKSTAGQVAFTTKGQNGSRDIFVTSDTGSAPINITSSPGDDMQPSWSPDGQQVAFSSGRTGNFDIFVANADGSNPVQLTSSHAFDEWPVWSPDGSRIAFVSDRSGNVELYVMNADGSNQQQLTNHPADDWPAAWSPDGQWLVFASNRDGNWSLYLIRAEGGSAFRLTNAPGDERDPIWSPDGKTIAFVYNGSGNFDVYTLPVTANIPAEVSSDNWTQITNTPTDERYPVWDITSGQLP